MFTIDTAIQTLTAEGWASADVITALDSFIAAGVDHEDPDGQELLDDYDLEVVRTQLTDWSYTITIYTAEV